MTRLTVIILTLLLGVAATADQGKKNQELKTVKVEIGKDGFQPAKIKAKAGEHLVLLVTRTTDSTCMKALKKEGDSKQVELPLDQEVRFDVGLLQKEANIKLLCGMDMTAGRVEVL